MDLATIAMDVGEIKAGVKTIIKNQESDHKTISEHDKRLTSLESRRWGVRFAVTAIGGVILAVFSKIFK